MRKSLAAPVGGKSDTELLDFLQSDVEEYGPLLLHDGSGECGRSRGLAWGPHLGRNLRGAIAAMMPKPIALTESPKPKRKGAAKA